MKSSILLYLLIGVTSSAILHVYHPSTFKDNAKCFECRSFEACIVSDSNRACIDRRLVMKEVDKSKFIEHGTFEEKITHHHKHLSTADHHKHDKLGNKDCSIMELQSVGGRLIQWFDTIHRQYEGIEDKSIRNGCKSSILWMFNEWDGNDDGYLSKNEIFSLIHSPKEPCIHQFIDHCDDIVTDSLISIDEWCDCLSYSSDIRNEPPCHKEKHSVDPHLKRSFIPRCDGDGFYSSEQCHSNECWCVDRYGREMNGSRVKGDLPDCAQYASSLSDKELQDLKENIAIL